MIERAAQTPVIVVFERYEPERLQDAVGHTPHRAEDFGHAVHRPRLGLECDFHKIALGERFSETQQPARYRNTLQFGFGAAPVFQTNRSQNGVAELDPGSAPRRVRLGEVGHRFRLIWHGRAVNEQITKARCPNSSARGKAAGCIPHHYKYLAFVSFLVNVPAKVACTTPSRFLTAYHSQYALLLC